MCSFGCCCCCFCCCCCYCFSFYIERQFVHGKPIGDFVQFWINQNANELNISLALTRECAHWTALMLCHQRMKYSLIYHMLNISIMYIINNSGPRVEPWCTSVSISLLTTDSIAVNISRVMWGKTSMGQNADLVFLEYDATNLLFDNVRHFCDLWMSIIFSQS